MNRIITWSELPDQLRRDGLDKLNSPATLRARETGLVTPYAWAERVAPFCRFTVAGRQRSVWDVNPLPWLQKRGIWSVFAIAPLPLDKINSNLNH